MLTINIRKVLKNSTAENLHQLSKLLGWTPPTVYKYTHPEKVSRLKIETIETIAKEIAKQKKISLLEVKLGDIFDFQKDS